MPRCTCSALVGDSDPVRLQFLMQQHLNAGVHEDHRFLEPGEVWPLEADPEALQ
jgi:hypothetical protein